MQPVGGGGGGGLPARWRPAGKLLGTQEVVTFEISQVITRQKLLFFKIHFFFLMLDL